MKTNKNINIIKIFSDSLESENKCNDLHKSNNIDFRTLPLYGSKFINKYERSRIIGIRAIQISRGGQVYVKTEGETNPIQLALKEYREKKIPFKLRRYLPDGRYKEFFIKDLIDICN